MTIRKSSSLPTSFLQGCGLYDWEIESIKLYNLGLTASEIMDIQQNIYELRAEKPLQIHNLFISHSHKDGDFIEYLEKHFKSSNIRYWSYEHHATAGPLESIVIRAINKNPTVLIVLSSNSIESDWVEFEVRKARELEKEIKQNVLCPIALDDSWEHCSWQKRVVEQLLNYNILDFSNWKDESSFLKVYKKLLDGLDLFYTKKV